jgi:hypothetical protein
LPIDTCEEVRKMPNVEAKGARPTSPRTASVGFAAM